MTWERRMIAEAEPASASRGRLPWSLPSRIRALFESQKQEWPLLSEGCRALSEVEVKRLTLDGSELVVQHNPGRIRSTAARVDRAAVQTRPCFLCVENLPPEERAIPYGNEFVILCNPLPVLPDHISIVHRDHVPQRIEGVAEMLLALAYDLRPDFFALYNGPECGASAPDHLHLQACRRSLLPLEKALREIDGPAAERCEICESAPRDEFELFTLSDWGRSAIVFRGNDPDRIARWVYEVMAELPVGIGAPEPMANVVAAHDDRLWTVFLFPRARHRPACFFADGADCITVSPGAIDMMGVVVVPQRDHFERVTPGLMQEIYAEVSLAEEKVNEAVERACERSGIREAV